MIRLISLTICFLYFTLSIKAQTVNKIKLVKDLNKSELCAYEILKSIIQNESIYKSNVEFFSKVEIKEDKEMLFINTIAKTQLKHFKSPSGSNTLRYYLILKNKAEINSTLNKDHISIKKSITYSPEYKIGTKVQCANLEWDLVKKTQQYLSDDIIDTDYFIQNENDFQEVIYVDKKYAIVKKDSKYGVISRNNQFLLTPSYDNIVKNKIGLLVKENNLYYFIDPSTKKKLSLDYSDVNVSANYELKQYLFPVKRNGKMAMLNANFEELVPLLYDNFTTVGFGKERNIIGKREGKSVLIDSRSGKEISKLYSSIQKISGNINHLQVVDAGKYGVINNNGEIIIDAKYDNLITSINNKEKNNLLYGLKMNNKIALFNHQKKNLITNYEFDEIFDLINFIGVRKGDKIGAINPDGKIIIPIKYNKLFVDRVMNVKEVTFTMKGIIGNNTIIFNNNGDCIENCK